MTDAIAILKPACTIARAPATSRKRALQIASDLLAEHHAGVSERLLFEALMDREQLGSTGLGDGVAIPHCRLEVGQIMAALITVESGIDYDAPDGAAVDVFYVLVVPPEETSAHLEILASLAQLFSSTEHRQSLRAASDDASLHQAFANALGGAPQANTG